MKPERNSQITATPGALGCPVQVRRRRKTENEIQGTQGGGTQPALRGSWQLSQKDKEELGIRNKQAIINSKRNQKIVLLG